MLNKDFPLIAQLEAGLFITSKQRRESLSLIADKDIDELSALLLVVMDEQLLRDKIASCFNLDTAQEVQLWQQDLDKLETLLKRYPVCPMFEDEDSLILLCCNPSDTNLLAAFYFITNKKIVLKVATFSEYSSVRYELESRWGIEHINQGISVSLTPNESIHEQHDLGKDLESDASPVANLVADIIDQALSMQASDIHFEPKSDAFAIRQRIDGVLAPVLTFPPTHINPINTRIKLMAKMDITEKRRPQDGRIQYTGKRDIVDIRVSSMMTMWGEKLVLRLLSSSKALLKIPQLGMPDKQMALFYQALSKKQGLVLVTGPTGSGKTQTLYAALDWLNHPSVNISTAEDPIEISLDGLNQTQINPIIEYDFARALKTFLRQDPDIIMLGEIRDFETADISVKASQTGHLVLSTLHTNSAIQTIYRLENLGITLFNIVTSVRLIIAQRLVRRLCPHCRIKIQAGYQANVDGCHHCHHGYKGRIGVYEFLPITPELAELIVRGAGEKEVANTAGKDTFVSLSSQGEALIRQGITDSKELNRVLG